MSEVAVTDTGPGRAVVLMSGGLDSCVAAAIARRDYGLYGLHADYGQRTQQRELEAFQAQADFFSLDGRLVVDLSYMKAIGGSSLTDSSLSVPEGDLKSRNIPNTYVPFRNAHFLSIAVSWAEVIGAEKIFIGAVAEDSSGYPDCREEYYEAMNAVIEIGTRPESSISIVAPLIGSRKSDIVKMGFDLGAPLDKTWSCYRNDGAACGTCDSCLLRLRAFEEANQTDPISYQTRSQLTGVK